MELFRSSSILFFAGIVKGMLSFGFGIIAASFLGLFLTPIVTVPLIIINSTLNNIVILVKKYTDIQWPIILPACLSGLVGIPFGVYFLRWVPADTMRIILGVIICIFGIILLQKRSLTKRKNNKQLLIIVGWIGGVLSGSVGIVGPPVALALQAMKSSKAHARANLIAFLTFVASATLIVFGSVGLLNSNLLPYLLLGTPAMLVGTYLGVLLGDKVSQKHFRTIIIFVAMLGGIVSILKGLHIL